MENNVGFLEAFKLYWINYINFAGRSTRAEFWWMVLWSVIASLPFIVIATFFSVLSLSIDGSGFNFIYTVILTIFSIVVLLVTFIPNLSLLVRRFHDTGRTMVVPIIFIAFKTIMHIVPILYDSVINFGYFYYVDINSELFVAVKSIFNIIYYGLIIYVIVIAILPSKQQGNKYGKDKKKQ